jgi:hypothetical protein
VVNLETVLAQVGLLQVQDLQELLGMLLLLLEAEQMSNQKLVNIYHLLVLYFNMVVIQVIMKVGVLEKLEEKI